MSCFVDRCLFFLLVIVLPVLLRFTISGYTSGILKLFFQCVNLQAQGQMYVFS